MANPGDQIQLCCLLWAHPGQEAALTAYEDQVLKLVPEHSGTVLQRAVSDGAEGRPHEIQLYRFASQAHLNAYLADPRRTALEEERDRAVAGTELFPVALQAEL
jgi:antibiotic biosynthesis monooxygenase (ABM) superfamily enzyme